MYTKKLMNKNILVLTRKKGMQLEKCPFCQTKHNHGLSDGHRIAHCAPNAHSFNKKKILEKVDINGVTVFRLDGYFIQTIC